MYDYIIGIDPSLTSTGVSVLPTDPITAYADIETKLVMTQPKDGRDFTRQRYILQTIDEFIDLHTQTKNCAVIIEAPGTGRFYGKAIQRIELLGMLKLVFSIRDCAVYTVVPTSLKKRIAGNGKASKTDMISAVFARTGLHYNSDDIADSVALSLYGYDKIINKVALDIEKIN